MIVEGAKLFMKLVELKIEEFEKFAESHSQFSFHQTKEWAKLKKFNGWSASYVGLKDKNKIVGVALILKKKLIFDKYLFYSPRGFLIDYSNRSLLEEFTKEIKIYAKKNKAIFIKIDPYLSYQERNRDGDIVDGGKNNFDAVDNLKKLGYKHYGFSISTEKELQPRWIYVLPINGLSEEDIWNGFSSDTKRYIQRAEKTGLITEEIGLEKLDEFKHIMEHTSKRRGFIDRPFSYYKEMVDVLAEHIKIVNCYMDTTFALSKLEDEEKVLQSSKNEVMEKLSVNPDSKKSKVALKEVEKKESELENKKQGILDLKEQYGDKILMASSMFIIYQNEVIYLYSGSYDEFMKYNPQYLIQWYMIRYAVKNNISRYNFYGIDGNFDKDKNPMYGIYEFKRGFGGNVEELIGEFDLIVNKALYYIYKISFWSYKKLKQIKMKLAGDK